MIYKIENLKLPIGADEDELRAVAAKKLGKKPGFFRILKKSLDARDKRNIGYVYSVEFSDDGFPKRRAAEKYIGVRKKIVVIGCGPAGLFAALRLIEHGFEPILIERGENVTDRTETVSAFLSGGRLDENSNVQFGAGGAGTYSDGKLNTQTHRGYNSDVLDLFAEFGAPEEILYLNKPHIGSDRLKGVVSRMISHISSYGEVRFSTRFEGYSTSGGTLREIVLRDLKAGVEYAETADAVVLALGHSARDTFVRLHGLGTAMEAREFAVGVRIEHLQSEINRAQYGSYAHRLPPADYKLVSHAGERTAFTFCMCPGGSVIPAASEEGGIVTNGMSDYARAGDNADSALLVQLSAADYGEKLFDGMEFQRRLERAAYGITGSYRAPVQLFGDFMKDRVSVGFGSVRPTYPIGTVFAPLGEILPSAVTRTIKAAVSDMGRRLRGFDSADALMTGVETRFSSPVRILRDGSGQSVSVRGLYPCGEGSGYSGGITSSAADGLRIADLIFADLSL